MTEDLEEKLNISDKELFSRFVAAFHEQMNKIWCDISLSDFIMAHVKSKTDASGLVFKPLQRDFRPITRLDTSQASPAKSGKAKKPLIEKFAIEPESISFKKSITELFVQIDNVFSSNADAQAFQFMPPFAVSIIQVAEDCDTVSQLLHDSQRTGRTHLHRRAG